MRKSPTPSAPRATASTAPSGLPRFARSGTGVPSARAPSVIGADDADARSSARRSARSSSSGVGAVVTTPAAASTITVSPSRRSLASTAPTMATIDFSRARIAVCEVGPPSVVTRASTLSRSRRAVSAGARSFATRTNGCPGSGTPGAGSPAQPRDDPLGDVVEIGRALAEVAAERGELVAERRERVEHRELARAALGQPGVDLVGEGRVLGHHRLRLEHLLSGPAGLQRRGPRARARRWPRHPPPVPSLRRRSACWARRPGRVQAPPSARQVPGRRPGRFRHLAARTCQASASWSVVSSSARVSSVASALSPSAVRVT